MDPDCLILLCTARGCTARVMTGRTDGMPDWTFADAGWCLAYLGERYRLAFMYRIAGDDSCRAPLQAEMLKKAREFQMRDQWPRKIGGRDYVPLMVEMLIDEERWRLSQRNNIVRSVVLNVSLRTWYRHFNKRYALLQTELEAWIGTAWRHIRGRLAGRR